jgi:hypothetical protein
MLTPLLLGASGAKEREASQFGFYYDSRNSFPSDRLAWLLKVRSQVLYFSPRPGPVNPQNHSYGTGMAQGSPLSPICSFSTSYHMLGECPGRPCIGKLGRRCPCSPLHFLPTHNPFNQGKLCIICLDGIMGRALQI